MKVFDPISLEKYRLLTIRRRATTRRRISKCSIWNEKILRSDTAKACIGCALVFHGFCIKSNQCNFLCDNCLVIKRFIQYKVFLRKKIGSRLFCLACLVFSCPVGLETCLVQTFFEFHIHPDYHVSNIKVNAAVFFLSKTFLYSHLFTHSKKCPLVASPPLASALTSTTTVAMPTCARALTQPTVKIPWPRPLTGCKCYLCGLSIVIVNICITDIDRYALSGNANPATQRTFLWT